MTFNISAHEQLLDLGFTHRRLESVYVDYSDGDSENGMRAPDFMPACDEYMRGEEVISIDQNGRVIFACDDNEVFLEEVL